MTDQLTILVVANLGMSTGKIAAQVSHATVGATRELSAGHPWLLSQKTVILAVANSLELDVFCEKAEKNGIKSYVVVDAGKTQVDPGTVTCAALGPGPTETIKYVTKYLRLYSWDNKEVYKGIENRIRREFSLP